MTKGREVVEDYRSHGLSLRPHPLAFLREELHGMGIAPCSALSGVKSGSRISVSGLIMVRQRPGSAKGVMFITLEDETGIANLIIWPSLFDQQRGVILGSQMMTCRGKVQSENGVINIIAEHLVDHTDMLSRIGGLNETFDVPSSRGDEARHGSGSPDARDTKLRKARDIFIPDLHIDQINVKARNFR